MSNVEIKDGHGEFDSDLDLGPCCACGEARPSVRNIMMLNYEAPIPGTGWGCLQCGLPMDGAVAVMCDECLEMVVRGERAELRFVVMGQPAEKKRMPTDELEKRPFKHNLELHPEVFDVRRCRVCGCTDDDGCPGGCYWIDDDLCSQCAGIWDYSHEDDNEPFPLPPREPFIDPVVVGEIYENDWDAWDNEEE